MDSIAARSGYNKTLIFRYYSNKLGLYTAVLQRADQELGQVLKRVFAPLLADESLVADAQRFREFLAATIGALFDYMVEHPRFTRIINWEQAAAWQTLQQQGADLVVSDVDMPRMDGFMLTEAVRNSKRFRDLPVVLVTARESEQDKARGIEVRADAYLVKSAFDQTSLLQAIRQLL